MTQEEKDLLLKDLCTRLTYDVKCNMDDRGVNIIGTLNSYQPLTKGRLLFGIRDKKYVAPDKYWQPNALFPVEKIKPYLRPMSSMTEEEVKELAYKILLQPDLSIVRNYKKLDIDFKYLDKFIEWINAHHFDYHGLIEKGLALEAPNGMYK